MWWRRGRRPGDGERDRDTGRWEPGWTGDGWLGPHGTDRLRQAFRDVPREFFLREADRGRVGHDGPVPIGHGQTNSQPRTVADMLRLLDVRRGHRVLDVGSGSGWTTGLLSALAGPDGEVLGLEIVPELATWGAQNLARLQSWAAQEGHGDQLAPARLEAADPAVLGRPEEGPWDRVLVSAMARRLPQALVDQLADDGRLVCPVDGEMLLVRRVDGEPHLSGHGAYRFVPLIDPR